MKVYVAGGLRAAANRIYLEQIAITLETNGYKVFLPHRDGEMPGKAGPEKGLVTSDDVDLGKMVFDGTLEELSSSDAMVAVLDGLCWGTTLELGYAYAYKKSFQKDFLIIGIYTNPIEKLDIMRHNACDHVLESSELLLDLMRLYTK